MTATPARTEPLRSLSIILFWAPLAATWLMMAAEGPYIAAIVARMPGAARNLAAYGVAVSLAWLVESPIMMLLSAATALVRDRASYFALRRFATILNVVVTFGMVVLALPPVFHFVGETLIHLPPEIAHLARAATLILIPWPAAIGYRRFYQGILVSHHFTRRVAYGTVVRLVTMSLTAGVLALTTSLPGAILGAIALVSGVLLEAGASRWMARHVVRSIKESGVVAEGTLLELGAIFRFYSPLALTSMLSMALGPLVTFGLGRGRAPLQSLAVWPVVVSTLFLFRSGGVAYQEVGIALTARGGERVRRTGVSLGVLATLALALLAFTPLETFWLERISGLSSELAGFAIWPIRLLVLLPFLEYLLSVQRTTWILARRTGVITVATAIESGGLLLVLLLTVGLLDLAGAVAGAIALIAGRLAANVFLSLMGRRESTQAR